MEGSSAPNAFYRWDKQRFKINVYTDKQESGDWLSDSFLAIEFRVTSSIDSKALPHMVGARNSLRRQSPNGGGADRLLP